LTPEAELASVHVDPVAEGFLHPNNYLNDLNSKDWVKRKRSWLVVNAVGEKEYRAGLKEEHPATYPKALVKHLLSCYTQRGHTVLDPFVGSGSTIVQAALMLRRSIGFDLSPDYIEMARGVLDLYRPPLDDHDPAEAWNPSDDDDPVEAWNPTLTVADALEGVRGLESDSIHYPLFSPPYANFLHRSSGGVVTRHKKRKAKGLPTTYSDSEQDLGNWEVEPWLAYLVTLAKELYRVTIKGHHMTIVVQNEMRVGLNPIAWKLALAIEAKTEWTLRPEVIWCQSEKKLTNHGWPKTFIINNHHHYCLNFFKSLDALDEKQQTLEGWI